LKWNSNHGPTNARLDKPSGGGKTGAWSSRTNDVNQWIQVKFCEVTKVTKVGIQGRYDHDQWVTKFKVSYSLDGVHFTTQSKVSVMKLLIERSLNVANVTEINSYTETVEDRYWPGSSFKVITEIVIFTGIRREQQP